MHKMVSVIVLACNAGGIAQLMNVQDCDEILLQLIVSILLWLQNKYFDLWTWLNLLWFEKQD